jgi:transposase
MIVLGADMHKRSHTVAAVGQSTGELVGDKTIPVGDRGFAAALDWASGLGDNRVWALEDCRHVSGSFERFLLVHGERVVRVATRLMAGERRAGRDRGKSDRIDALAVARAALREGLERLPIAELCGVELDIRLLVDHRERLVRMRTALYNDLLWHLHDLWPEQTFPGCALLSKKWTATIGRRLARAEQIARVRIARDELRHLRELSETIDALEAEVADLVAEVAPQLLAEPGFGPLTAGNSSARSPARSASPPTPSSPARAASRRSRSARATPTATASTAAATARSTPPFTASRSPARAVTPRPRPTSTANEPRAKPAPRPSAASNATSPAASGTYSSRPARRRSLSIS